MALSEWTETKKKYVPRVSVRANGSMCFNAGAINKFGFGTRIKHISLAYDPEEKVIVIRPVDAKDSRAVSLKPNLKLYIAWVRNFYRLFEIDFSRTRKFSIVVSERYEKAFEVNIASEVTPGRVSE